MKKKFALTMLAFMLSLSMTETFAAGNFHYSAGSLSHLVYVAIMVRRGREVFINLVNISGRVVCVSSQR